MRQPAVLRSYLLRIVAPAIALTVVGFAVLLLQYRGDVRRQDEVLQARALNAAADFRDTVREAGNDPESRKAAMLSMIDVVPDSFAVRPSGAFAWEPKKGIVWQQGVSGELSLRISERQYWKDWFPPSSKKAAHRSAERVKLDDSEVYLLLGRVDDRLYAFVFDAFPVSIDSWTWMWLVCIGFTVSLAMFLVYAAVQLWHAAEKARRDDELKTRFVSDVSHELKTPLAAMGLWADMLAGGRIADEKRKSHAMAVIAEEKGRMLRMVDTLLDFTRLEQGRRMYKMETIDIGETVRKTVDMLRGDFPDHGISAVAPEGCEASADRDAVKSILVNLLSNAAKYAAPSGPVEVSVSSVDGWMKVAVADRGPGIALQDRERIFERFYRTDDSAVLAKGGFGLGLPISRRLARDMGGELAFEPRSDGGSIFVLTLRIASN